ncbi:type II toxin-antitoxin system ParD family antitoxin [Chroococcidiopsis sp. CCALA 051]|uniref:ribbon-helix-helix domain-containing protein n=1 Tax=Chroococcidiopsis sp. CCALA 051 TaxID=869949 RepID=UPI000D0DF41D|nr:type II toxin-antitoxin system ParD family antitoxin [Chroococcidiopsis sp. CCALA 051]MBE9017343.1 type II toxin-antitoxin system ParD family antitoxin [Chroococcidiopsidales cyanobacterium LEGE 13417]PSM45509.1 type II toxin-antitoxin system ParD family antitoxin [Chroococcidiopsis sp. CCALA 051]
MNITLKPEQEKTVQTLLASGKFHSVEEVIQAALHLLEEDYRGYQQWLEEVRVKIDEATEASKHTPPIDGETYVAQLLKRFQQAREAQK